MFGIGKSDTVPEFASCRLIASF